MIGTIVVQTPVKSSVTQTWHVQRQNPDSPYDWQGWERCESLETAIAMRNLCRNKYPEYNFRAVTIITTVVVLEV